MYGARDMPTQGPPPLEAERLGLDQPEWSAIVKESVDLLRGLLAIDTSNPPGNESALTRFLSAFLRDSGIDGEVLGAEADRLNLVASIAGSAAGPHLVLLSHADVVPAGSQPWTMPPFGGQVAGCAVWGRGAQDMKNQTAAHAMALMRLVRSGAIRSGRLTLVVSADEEVGEACGAQWLVEHEPGLVKCDYLLTEPVLPTLRGPKGLVVPLAVGEKTRVHLRLRCGGSGGHASSVPRSRNPVYALAGCLTRIAGAELDAHPGPMGQRYLEALLDGSLAPRVADPRTRRPALDEVASRDAAMARTLESIVATSVAPTVITSPTSAVNVVPDHATVDLDCRLPLDQDPSRLITAIRSALASQSDWELSSADVTLGNESSPSSALADAAAAVIAQASPEAALLPIHSPGFTDAHWFRSSWPSISAYGFCPSFCDDHAFFTMHAPDERVAVSDLALQAACYEHVIRGILG
jgi:acetylornithine deacetylase/succinyl-diaminopimelate desuccinylase-like protein